MSTDIRAVRDSNIELLRIVLMFMIIMHHLIAHGCRLADMIFNAYTGDSELKDSVLIFLNTFCVIGVNCFIFISGYYGMKFKLNTLISFVIQAIFYSVIIYFIFNIFFYKNDDLLNRQLIQVFLPITFGNWWFLSAYVGIYLLSPIINKGLDYLTQYQFIVIFSILFYFGFISSVYSPNYFTGSGFNINTLLLVYITARFCKRFFDKIDKAFILYILFLIFSFGLIYFAFISGKQYLSWRLVAYNSPLILILSILFFYSFKNLKIKSKLINRLTPYIFGVYLIHDSPQIHSFLRDTIQEINSDIGIILLLVILFCSTILIFIICLGIEKIRVLLCNPLINLINKKLLPIQDKLKSIQ